MFFLKSLWPAFFVLFGGFLAFLPGPGGQALAQAAGQARTEAAGESEENASMPMALMNMRMIQQKAAAYMERLSPQLELEKALSRSGLLPESSSLSMDFLPGLLLMDLSLGFLNERINIKLMEIMLKEDLSDIEKTSEMINALNNFKTSSGKEGSFKNYIGEKLNEDMIKESIYNVSAQVMQPSGQGAPAFYSGLQIYSVGDGEEEGGASILARYLIGLPVVGALYGAPYEARREAEEGYYQDVIDQISESGARAIGVNMYDNHYTLGIMKLAGYIRENNMDIYVLGYCSLTCSNYLLPAARNIYIEPYGVILYEGSSPSLIADDVGKRIEISMKKAKEEHQRRLALPGGAGGYIYNAGGAETLDEFFERLIYYSVRDERRAGVFTELIKKIKAIQRRLAPLSDFSGEEAASLFADFSPEEMAFARGCLLKAESAAGKGEKSGKEHEKNIQEAQEAQEAGGAANYFFQAAAEAKEEKLQSCLKEESPEAFEKFFNAVGEARGRIIPVRNFPEQDIIDLFADFGQEEQRFISDFLFSSQYGSLEREDQMYAHISQSAAAELEFLSDFAQPAYKKFLRFVHGQASYNPGVADALGLQEEERGHVPEKDRFRYIIPSAEVLRSVGLNIVRGENRAENLYIDPNDPRGASYINLDAEAVQKCGFILDGAESSSEKERGAGFCF